jgi:hypothetical protein
MGCVYFYAFTGRDLFYSQSRIFQDNIQSGSFKPNFELLQLLSTKWEVSILEDPTKRPSAEQVLKNPIFWDCPKIRRFIETCNDIAMANEKLKGKFDKEHIFDGNWLESIHDDIKGRVLKHNKNLDGSKNIHLLNSVRNAVRSLIIQENFDYNSRFSR